MNDHSDQPIRPATLSRAEVLSEAHLLEAQISQLQEKQYRLLDPIFKEMTQEMADRRGTRVPLEYATELLHRIRSFPSPVLRSELRTVYIQCIQWE